MSSSKSWRVKLKKNHFVVIYGDTTLLKISKGGLRSFLADLDLDVDSPAQKPGDQLLSEDELFTNALQLSKAYASEKRKFYKSKYVKEISPKDKSFQHFIEAARMCKQHNVTYKRFLKAQVKGLHFVENGRGIFPRPNQISTELAETRLLDYLRSTITDSSGDDIKVNLSGKDSKTPLSQNHRYLACIQRIKDGVSTLKETGYVRELQLVRRGKVQPWVVERLEKLL